MLAAGIEAGMPKELFVPSKIDFAAVHEKATQLAKAEGLDGPNDDVWKDMNKDTTESEQETIAMMNDACVE